MKPLNDVIFSPDVWRVALEKYAISTHLTVKLFGQDAEAVLGPVHPTPLFQLFAERGYDPGIYNECAGRCLTQTSRDRPGVVISQFHGLSVIGTSLFLEGEIVGAAVGGYAFLDFSQVSEVQLLAREAGIPFAKLWDVARQQKPVPRYRLIGNAELLQVLGDALLGENLRSRQYQKVAIDLKKADVAKDEQIVARRALNDQLAAELADTKLLQQISTQVSAEGSRSLFKEVLDAAVAIMRSDMASMQIYHADQGELQLLGSKGFSPEAVKFWDRVYPGAGCTCGEALRTGQRAIARDIETCDFMRGTPDLDAYRQAGIRAVQSTPLLSRSGRMLGMISNHWREPHEPAERDLRLLDVLARQAADLVEHKMAQQDLAEMLLREQQARHDAEAANRAKDQFLAVVSHELRTPLTPILMWTHMLKSGSDPTEIARAMEMIQRNAMWQLRLIEDLLDLSRVTNGKMTVQLVEHDLGASLRSALESVHVDAEKKRLALETAGTDAPLPVRADAGRIQQVFTNILGNAVKFTPSGGAIRVTLGSEANTAVVKFEDTGGGIAPEFLPHVFEMFHQEEGGTQRPHTGLGIGLALSKRLIDLHGGNIEINSKGRGLGTTVTIRLPLDTQVRELIPRKPPAVLAQIPAALKGVSILLVEDSDDTRNAIEAMLRQLGAEVSSAADGREALDRMATANADLVLCDLAMPRMDGFEFIKELRSLHATVHLPVIAVTALVSEANQERTRAAGFAGHLNKPFDDVSLLSAIKSVQCAA